MGREGVDHPYRPGHVMEAFTGLLGGCSPKEKAKQRHRFGSHHPVVINATRAPAKSKESCHVLSSVTDAGAMR